MVKKIDFTRTVDELFHAAVNSISYYALDDGTPRKQMAWKLTEDFPELADIYIGHFIEYWRKVGKAYRDASKGEYSTNIDKYHELRKPACKKLIENIDQVAEEILKRVKAFNLYCGNKGVEEGMQFQLHILSGGAPVGFDMMPDSLVLSWWIQILYERIVKMYTEINKVKSEKRLSVSSFSSSIGEAFFEVKCRGKKYEEWPGCNKSSMCSTPFCRYYGIDHDTAQFLREQCDILTVEYIFAHSHTVFNRKVPQKLFGNVKEYMDELKKPIDIYVKNLQKIGRAKKNKEQLMAHAIDELIDGITKVINPNAKGSAAAAIGELATGIVNQSIILNFEDAIAKLSDELMIGIIHLVSTSSIDDLLWHSNIVKNWNKLNKDNLKKYLEE